MSTVVCSTRSNGTDLKEAEKLLKGLKKKLEKIGTARDLANLADLHKAFEIVKTKPKPRALDKHNETPNGAYSKHVGQLNAAFQKSLKKYNIKLDIHLVPKKTATKQIKTMMESGKFDDENSRIWENQLETLAEIIHYLITDPSKSIVLIGSTQLGKTMLLICASILEHILSVTQTERYRAVIIGPGRTALHDQTEKDYRFVRNNYEFEVEGETFTDFKQQLRDQIGDCKEETDTPVYRRTNGDKTLNEMRAIVDNAHSNGVRVIFIIDECHWGSQEKGVLDKIIGYAKELTAKKDGDLMIAISATPFQLGNLAGLNKVFCRTYEGYVGYPFWRGEYLDKRYVPIYPKPIAFDEVEKTVGVKHFERVSRRFYMSSVAFNVEKVRMVKGKYHGTKELCEFGQIWKNKTHQQYKEFCESKIIDLVKRCLIDRNDIGGKGFIIRFFNKNTVAAEFLERRAKDFLKLGVKAVSWQGEEAKQSLNEHLRNNEIQQDDLKVIFVTGSGRMGNRIQDEDKIYYGADFSTDSNLTAVLQGLLGRMTGKKSQAPIVFLERKIVNSLRLYESSLGEMFTKKPHNRTKMASITHFGKDASIYFEKQEGKLDIYSLGLENWGELIKKWTKEKVLQKRLTNGTLSIDVSKGFVSQILSDKNLTGIERALHVKKNSLVRRWEGKIDDTGLKIKGKPYIDDEGFAYGDRVGLRTEGKQSTGNSTLGGLRSSRVRSGTKDGIKRLQPQLHIQCIEHERGFYWVPVVIKLRFCEKTNYGSGLVLPNQKDFGFQFVNDDENSKITNIGL